MLVRRLMVRKELMRLTCLLKVTRCSSQVAVEPELTGHRSDLRLTANRPKQPKREPFAKNLFLGKFDLEFLAYPEAQCGPRHRDFFEWLKPIEDYINENVDLREIDANAMVKNEIFQELEKLGVFRAAVDEAYGGLGLNYTEYAKLVETISAVPVLGTYMTKRAAIVKLITTHATEEQKSDLLPKIANGELIPTLCFSENPTGSTTDPLVAKAMISDCRTSLIINAHKTCVFDATRSNLFIVLAQNTSSDQYVKNQSMGAFIIPKSTKGVSVGQPASTLGQRGVDVCSVNFDNVAIPPEKQLGIDIAQESLFISALGEGKHNVGAEAVGVLKRFLNLLTTSIRESKSFNSKRLQEDSMHEVIGKIASTLYAMEAMIYLTTGMMDNFEDQDCTLEQSLVESYCTTACVDAILKGMAVLGSTGYLKDQPFEQIVRDSLALTTYDRSAIDVKIFAALLGVQHAGVSMGPKVKQERNPLFNPLEILKANISFGRIPNLRIDEHLHPSLRVAAKSLEASVHKIKNCVSILLIKHGINVLNRRMELRRLADIMIEIYAMTAVVARASRSYCTGLRNSEQEVKVALIFTFYTYEKVISIEKELNDGDWINGDVLFKDIANSTFEKREYFASHPLERNV